MSADETRERSSVRSDHPEPARIAWIVDAQPEFLDRKGKLHIFGVDGVERMATRKAAASLAWAVDWLAGVCSLMVYVGNGHGAGGAQVFDPIRPVDPLVLSRDASEDEAESLAHRALGEGRAVVASRASDGGFEGASPAGLFWPLSKTRSTGPWSFSLRESPGTARWFGWWTPCFCMATG